MGGAKNSLGDMPAIERAADFLCRKVRRKRYPLFWVLVFRKAAEKLDSQLYGKRFSRRKA